MASADLAVTALSSAAFSIASAFSPAATPS